MKYKITLVFVLLGLFAAVNFATRPLVNFAAKDRMEISVKASLGEGVLWGLLGGYRTLVADYIWLKSYLAWEKEDRERCLANIELASKLSPEVTMFWHMGAGIISRDMPHWILDRHENPESVQNIVRKNQAKIALDFLDRGLKFMPENRRLLMDKGDIYEDILKDKKEAIACYEKASEGEAPLYVVRVLARKLSSDGQDQKALEALLRAAEYSNKKHPSYEFLQEHIEELQDKLNIKQN